jgi:hypothetical protein
MMMGPEVKMDLDGTISNAMAKRNDRESIKEYVPM